jgi:hypothetical protein
VDLAIGDIGERAGDPSRDAAVIANDNSAGQHPAMIAIAVEHAMF